MPERERRRETLLARKHMVMSSVQKKAQVLAIGAEGEGPEPALLARKHMVMSSVQKKAQVLAIGAEGEGPEPVRDPELNAGFEVWPHQCKVEGDDCCPGPAGHTMADQGQDAIGGLGHQGTLLAHVQLLL
ncbi:hypothetical protein HGM15179_004700 [Zosterops borbonicus]|uniref:Uncharacterized protein n=1 Tax=Zosterops borbonicus TaxID=364589 RepID=A0A8K1LQJ6_9PASS|nr:hypothetical protein HGM15179_004700 [Zosterops borbonicus]